MSQYPIAVVVGSLRRGSFNRKLVTVIAKLAPPEFSFKRVQIGDLPLYNKDDDASPVGSVKRPKSEITAARGLLFVTAGYNRSIPGVLKNAIDHASRPYGRGAWAGKPAGVMGVSVGAIGTAVAHSICAPYSRIWTCRRWASPKRSSTPRKDCSTRAATSGKTAGSSCRTG